MAPDHTALNDMLSDYAVIRSTGTGELAGVSLVADTNQPYFEEDPDGDDHELDDPWSLLTGFTGQHGYSGPGLHASEYIGGGLARHILDTPGLYTVFYGQDSWYVAYKDEGLL